MASGIRGITVEINGNTKKLIDALKETGKETKDIKAELAQVDKIGRASCRERVCMFV